METHYDKADGAKPRPPCLFYMITNPIKMKNQILTFFLIALMVAGCDVMDGDPIEDSQLHGTWTGIAITRDGTPTGENPAKMAFEFKPDSTYIRRQGAGMEEGTWHVYNSKLYTTAKGRHEIFVHIDLPAPDTLVIEQMRDGGIKEFWTFKKG